MSIDFNNGYQPPGVYVQEDAGTTIVQTGVPPSRVAIVGPGLGYETNTDQVRLVNAPGVVLGKKGITLTTVAVQTSDGTPLSLGTDYTLAAGSAGPLGTQDYEVTLTRAGSGATVPSGTAIFVSYQFVPPDYFEAQLFEDFDQVRMIYGDPINYARQSRGDLTYQPILSPLSLAAQIAFENGADEVLIVATALPGSDLTTDSQRSAFRRTALANAYQKLETDYTAAIIVPVTTGIITADAIGVAQDLNTHINQTSSAGYFRIGIIGFEPAVTTAPDTLLNSGNLANKRLMLAYASPGGMSYFAGGANTAYPVGHQYLAAAYAGAMASMPYQNSITRQQVRSFVGVTGTPISNALKNQYAAAGVAVTELDRLGRLVIRHALMSDMSSVNTRESSVVRAKDALVILTTYGFENSGLLGDPIDDDSPLAVKSVMAGLLEHAIRLGTIVSYTSLGARVSQTNPTVIEVKFSYRPAYPLNYISVVFTIDLNTGFVDLAA